MAPKPKSTGTRSDLPSCSDASTPWERVMLRSILASSKPLNTQPIRRKVCEGLAGSICDQLSVDRDKGLVRKACLPSDLAAWIHEADEATPLPDFQR